jgi:nicotinamide mononucleotide transporter
VQFINQLLTQLQQTSLLEWLAFVFGILQVVLAIKNNTLNFYAGIISVCIYTVVFYNMGLFAESLLNVYYFIISIQGIYLWKLNNQQTALAISYTNKSEKIKTLFIIVLSFVVLYFLLKTYTSSNVPLLDAFVTSTAFSGTWLLTKRKIENWILLSISNSVAIPLQFYKHMELTSILTSIFLVLGIIGYFNWKKEVKKGRNNIT